VADILVGQPEAAAWVPPIAAPSRARRVPRNVAAAVVALAVGIVLVAAGPAAAAAGEPVTSPAANDVFAQSPSRVTLQGASRVDASGGRLVLYDAAHKQVAGGELSRHGSTLVGDVPKLGDGIYTAVWQLAGAQKSTGSFAFAVNEGGTSPALVQQAKPETALNPAGRVIPKWLALTAIIIFIGVCALRLFVTAPATRGMEAEEEEQSAMLAAGDRRLLVLAGAAILLFIPATLGDLVNRATDKDAGLSFWQSIHPGAIADYLTGGPEGTLYDIRLVLTALAALVVVPAAAAALRRGWRHRPQLVGRVMLAGLVLGTAETIVRVIPTEAPKEGIGWPREIFTDVLDWGHMYSAAIWIGGLAGLAVLGASLRVPAARRGRFWPVALRRFSVIATVCVGAMILSGLWMAWLHVGAPRLLVHTLYGETLLVKLVLVLILLGVAAANQLWLLPRIDAMRAQNGGSRSSIVLRHFRKTVAAEAVLGMLILLVVPFLSGSARNQEFQAQAADLTQTRHFGGHAVSLRPSGAQPGLTDYDVWAPGAGDRVTVAFSSAQLGVPETEVLATSLGGGHYRVTGLYTAMAGAWQARVVTKREPPASFGLDVTATSPEPENAPPAVVSGSTWAWGLGELLAIVFLLGGAGYSSRRLARRRIAPSTLATAERAS
jgi:putative copper export protein/methionine-rich copper-binding protein CopC